MVAGRPKLLSLAVLSGLGVDVVRGVYNLPQNVTVSSNSEAYSQSTVVDADETLILLSSVESTVEVTSASQTISAAGAETLAVGSLNSLQPTTQDVVAASEPTTSTPPISTASTALDPSLPAPSEDISSAVTVIVISSLSATDSSEAGKTSGLTSDLSSIDGEKSTITAGPLPSSAFTSSTSLAWNYAPVGKESQSLGQEGPLPTEGPIGGDIVYLPPDMPPWADQTLVDGGDVTLGQPPINLPPDIPPWVEQTTVDGGDATLGQPSVSIPVSWDYVPATTTSDAAATTRGQFISSGGWNQTTASFFNQSSTRTSGFANTTTTFSSKTVSYCQPSDLTATVTSWEVVHISTITWIGDSSNYTQPYPTLIPPSVETFPPCIDLVTKTEPPPGITLTTCFTITASGGSEIPTCTLTISTNSWGYGPQTSTSIRFAPTVTYITTDKNPAVVYSPMQTPDYGATNEFTNSPRPTAGGVDPVDPPVYNTFHTSNNGPKGEETKPAPKPVTVIVKPSEVVIGTSTIADNPTTKTQTVVVGGETFTVGPTRVVGGGATVTRPTSTSRGGSGGGAGAGAGVIYVPKPTSTKLNDLPIIISSSVAVIGTSSSTFTLPPTPTTVVVDDHTVSLGPGGIAIVDPKGNPVIATVTIPPPPRGDQAITIGPDPAPNNGDQPTKTTTVDGLPITIISSSIAIIGVGPSSSTTLIFPAPGSSPTTITINNPNSNGNGNGDQKHTLTLGPSGITLTAPALPATGVITTIQTLSIPLPSGAAQPPPKTEVIIAGGSLLTAIGQSVVVIYGTTITYTTLSSPLTTIIDNDETVVLDPKAGVIVTHNHPVAGVPSPGGTAAGPMVTTIGGPSADPKETEYGVVGGVTMTKVGASVVVVEGVTYTVGPDATVTTTVLGGGTGGGQPQTVIIGPDGVVVGGPGGTTTIQYPFDGDEGSSTTVIFPGAEPAAASASATAGGDGRGVGEGEAKDGKDDDEDAGVAIKVMWSVMMLGLGVAGAVGVFGL